MLKRVVARVPRENHEAAVSQGVAAAPCIMFTLRVPWEKPNGSIQCRYFVCPLETLEYVLLRDLVHYISLPPHCTSYMPRRGRRQLHARVLGTFTAPLTDSASSGQGRLLH